MIQTSPVWGLNKKMDQFKFSEWLELLKVCSAWQTVSVDISTAKQKGSSKSVQSCWVAVKTTAVRSQSFEFRIDDHSHLELWANCSEFTSGPGYRARSLMNVKDEIETRTSWIHGSMDWKLAICCSSKLVKTNDFNNIFSFNESLHYNTESNESKINYSFNELLNAYWTPLILKWVKCCSVNNNGWFTSCPCIKCKALQIRF